MLKQIVKSCDIYGTDFHLRVNNSSKFKTLLGGIFSIITVVFIFICIYIFGLDFLSRSKAEFNYDKLDNNSIDKMLFSSDDVKKRLFEHNDKGYFVFSVKKELIEKGYLIAFIEYSEINSINAKNNSKNLSYIFPNLCSEETEINIGMNSIKTPNSNNIETNLNLCFDRYNFKGRSIFENTKFEKSNTSSKVYIFRPVYFILKHCKDILKEDPTIELPINCNMDDPMEKEFQNNAYSSYNNLVNNNYEFLNVDFFTSSVLMRKLDYDKPMSITYEKYTLKYNIKSINSYNNKYTAHYLLDDKGYIFSNHHYYMAYEVTQPIMIQSNGPIYINKKPDHYMHITVSIDLFGLLYIRSFEKVPQFLALLGGFFKVITFSIGILINTAKMYNYDMHFVHSNFNIYDKESYWNFNDNNNNNNNICSNKSNKKSKIYIKNVKQSNVSDITNKNSDLSNSSNIYLEKYNNNIEKSSISNSSLNRSKDKRYNTTNKELKNNQYYYIKSNLETKKIKNNNLITMFKNNDNYNTKAYNTVIASNNAANNIKTLNSSNLNKKNSNSIINDIKTISKTLSNSSFSSKINISNIKDNKYNNNNNISAFNNTNPNNKLINKSNNKKILDMPNFIWTYIKASFNLFIGKRIKIKEYLEQQIKNEKIYKLQSALEITYKKKSIDYILSKIHEFDVLKHFWMNDDQFLALSMIENPCVGKDNSNINNDRIMMLNNFLLMDKEDKEDRIISYFSEILRDQGEHMSDIDYKLLNSLNENVQSKINEKFIHMNAINNDNDFDKNIVDTFNNNNNTEKSCGSDKEN